MSESKIGSDEKNNNFKSVTTQSASMQPVLKQLEGSGWFPDWKPYAGNLEAPTASAVGINEYLPVGKSILLGIQHTFAMFGATVLAPLLMGFDANLAILMSGLCTILFFLMTGGRLPSYLGSSFAFIAPVLTVTAFTAGSGTNPNLSVALGGIIVCGIIYSLIGLLVMKVGTHWIETLMPPVVTGAIVMIIGLNLAPVTVSGVMAQPFDAWIALITVLCIGTVAVFTRGMLRRLLLLVGLIAAYLFYFLLTNIFGLGTPIDYSGVAAASWVGMPSFISPTFSHEAIILIAPVAFILVAENLGHFKAVEGMTQTHVTPYVGRGFFADGIATTLSASVGGTGLTTYAENIGVMAVTKVYSTTIFVLAGVVAIILGLSPKFGAIIQSIPSPILGGASIVVFGLITVSGIKIWLDNNIDFNKNSNLIIGAVTVIMGTGDFSLGFGSFDLGGIGTATLLAILLNLIFKWRNFD